MSERAPLQDVADRFQNDYNYGGLPVVERLVSELAVEMIAAAILATAADAIEHERSQYYVDQSEEIDTLGMVSGFHLDKVTAASRYAHAEFMYNEVKQLR